MSFLFHNFFYAPLYNGLILFINIIPFHSVGLAVVFFTCIIKVLIFPLSQKSIKTQFDMKQIEPEINEIKIAEGTDHISPLKLSAVSSNLEYIPLETTT